MDGGEEGPKDRPTPRTTVPRLVLGAVAITVGAIGTASSGCHALLDDIGTEPGASATTTTTPSTLPSATARLDPSGPCDVALGFGAPTLVEEISDAAEDEYAVTFSADGSFGVLSRGETSPRYHEVRRDSSGRLVVTREPFLASDETQRFLRPSMSPDGLRLFVTQLKPPINPSRQVVVELSRSATSEPFGGVFQARFPDGKPVQYAAFHARKDLYYLTVPGSGGSYQVCSTIGNADCRVVFGQDPRIARALVDSAERILYVEGEAGGISFLAPKLGDGGVTFVAPRVPLELTGYPEPHLEHLSPGGCSLFFTARGRTSRDVFRLDRVGAK